MLLTMIYSVTNPKNYVNVIWQLFRKAFSTNCSSHKYFVTNEPLEDHLWQYLRQCILNFLLISQICASTAFGESFSEIRFRGGQKWLFEMRRRECGISE